MAKQAKAPKQTLLKLAAGEKVEVVKVKRTPKGHRYAVTNQGRVIRFKTNNPLEGEWMVQYRISANYPCVYIQWDGKRMNYMVHRLVAQYFLPKPKRDQIYVIHKDRKKENNHVSNLSWANKTEHLAHAMAGEAWQLATKRVRNSKLTEAKVKALRKKIDQGKWSMKVLAKEFGITEMQLYRIKKRQNWNWVK